MPARSPKNGAQFVEVESVSSSVMSGFAPAIHVDPRGRAGDNKMKEPRIFIEFSPGARDILDSVLNCSFLPHAWRDGRGRFLACRGACKAGGYEETEIQPARDYPCRGGNSFGGLFGCLRRRVVQPGARRPAGHRTA